MREIPLTKGKVALVSDEDYERVAAFKWTATWSGRHWYAYRQFLSDGKMITIKMHRFVTGAHEHEVVDHRDRDGLNNQRPNLRKCSQSENLGNSSAHRDKAGNLPKGVSFDRARGKFAAAVTKNGKRHHLGRFATVEQASLAYQAKHQELYGQFSRC